MTNDRVPYGYCQCGCGSKTTIPKVTDRNRGWVKGVPIKFKTGHNRRSPHPPRPTHCACGCGSELPKAKYPSAQSIYINGHNNRRNVADRFWSRVAKGGIDDCWNWIAGIGTHGYGRMSVDGCPESSHRISWQLNNGPIPQGLHVLHRCDNRICCNPNHLFLGTNLDNINDMVSKNRQAKSPHKPAKRGEENSRAVLTKDQVVEIRQRCASGESQDLLAEIYGVSQGHISNVYRRVTWKHVK